MGGGGEIPTGTAPIPVKPDGQPPIADAKPDIPTGNGQGLDSGTVAPTEAVGEQNPAGAGNEDGQAPVDLTTNGKVGMPDLAALQALAQGQKTAEDRKREREETEKKRVEEINRNWKQDKQTDQPGAVDLFLEAYDTENLDTIARCLNRASPNSIPADQLADPAVLAENQKIKAEIQRRQEVLRGNTELQKTLTDLKKMLALEKAASEGPDKTKYGDPIHGLFVDPADRKVYCIATVQKPIVDALEALAQDDAYLANDPALITRVSEVHNFLASRMVRNPFPDQNGPFYIFEPSEERKVECEVANIAMETLEATAKSAGASLWVEGRFNEEALKDVSPDPVVGHLIRLLPTYWKASTPEAQRRLIPYIYSMLKHYDFAAQAEGNPVFAGLDKRMKDLAGHDQYFAAAGAGMETYLSRKYIMPNRDGVSEANTVISLEDQLDALFIASACQGNLRLSLVGGRYIWRLPERAEAVLQELKVDPQTRENIIALAVTDPDNPTVPCAARLFLQNELGFDLSMLNSPDSAVRYGRETATGLNLMRPENERLSQEEVDGRGRIYTTQSSGIGREYKNKKDWRKWVRGKMVGVGLMLLMFSPNIGALMNAGEEGERQ